ncbi:hypothetical protein Hanom_Chr02g00125281 [Helianthus anomalus]
MLFLQKKINHEIIQSQDKHVLRRNKYSKQSNINRNQLKYLIRIYVQPNHGCNL